jgi:ATP-dependent Lhr-like helicase
VLCFRDQAHLLAPPLGDHPDSDLHDTLRAHLGDAGASFWPELFAASGVADQDEVLAALWDLVWAGEVTNDTLAPLRGLLAAGTGGRSTRRSGRPGALRRAGPPAARGRWSSTAHLRTAVPDATVGTARAGQLLERWGVVTADAVRGEGHRGGFAGVYEVFKAMEETGQVRRGYFVEGLGGAQFAPAGAVDRLRDHRDPPRDGPVVVRLAATDPAQAYGSALPWPDSDGRPARQAGAHVVQVDGVCVLYVERGARSLATFPATADTVEHWGPALAGLVTDGRLPKLEITRVDGTDVFDHPLADALVAQGLTAGYRGMVLRG